MSFYQDMAATAAEMLAEFGMSATISRALSAGGYDPTTGTTLTAITEQWTVNLAQLEYDSKDIDGTLILRGDKRLLIDPSETAPKAGDVVTLNDGDVTIVSVSTLAPSGLALLYEAQARG